MDTKYPRIAEGTCTVCGKENSKDFQLTPSKVICSECKVHIGEKLKLHMFKTITDAFKRKE